MHIISQSNQLLKIIHLIDKFRGFKHRGRNKESTKQRASKQIHKMLSLTKLFKR